MAKKHAILIANTEYRDGKLTALPHPGLAYAELADALRDPARGAFTQVETLVNANLSHVLNTLDRFFARKPADDVLLVYVGTHGFVDAQGELFLALKESDRFRLKSTALMAAVLGMNMDQCPSPHKLLILDCRFHTPYQDSRGGAPGPKVDPAKVFSGRGLPKLILAASEQPLPQARPTPAASTTQKLQIVAPKDFTKALAETFRTPSTANGGRNAFTVEDWWNDAAAELRASKAEPPTRHTVGDPPLTILRGASLPRPELALSSLGPESKVLMPALPQEPEADWSRLSGIFPLEMFAPGFTPPAAEGDAAAGADATDAAEEPPAPEAPAERTLEMDVPRRGDETIVADRSFIEGADLVLRARQQIESQEPLEGGTLESPLSTSPTLEVPLPEGLEHAAAPLDADGIEPMADLEGTPPERRPDATLMFDLRVPPDLSGSATMMWERPKDDTTPSLPAGPGPKGPRDTFTDLRARLHAQQEQEQQARIDAEKEEAAQREKLEQWKARWDSRQGGKPKPEEKPKVEPPMSSAPPPPAPKGSAYQKKVQALQKTMYVPGPDVDPGAEAAAQPTQAPEAPSHPPAPGMATVIVSKDQFLNTGVHKAVTELVPGATLHIPRNELFNEATGTREAAAPTLEMETAEPERPARPVRGDRGRKGPSAPKPPRGGDGKPPSARPGGGRRKLALWILAGLAPVGLGLFLFFGYQAGLFLPLGLGQAPEASAPRNPSATFPSRPSGTDADPSSRAPAASLLPSPPENVVPAAVTSAAPAGKPAPAAAAPLAPVAKPVPAPRPADPARLARLQADSVRKAEEAARREAAKAEEAARREAAKSAKAAQDADKVARAKFRLDSLKAYRASRDSILTARAQAKQDSLAQLRLIRDLERAQQAEIDAIRMSAAKARQDSVKAAKDSVQSEGLLRKSVNQALRADAQEMRGLYNRFALGYPGLKGEVVVNLLVAPSGEIEKGTIHSSSTGIKMFDQLVLGNVMEWKIRPFKSREAKAILVPLKFPLD